MKSAALAIASVIAFSAAAQSYDGVSGALRVNNVGYLTDDFKAAVYMGPLPVDELSFEISSPDTGIVAVDSAIVAPAWGQIPYAGRIYFSSLTTPGEYALSARRASDGSVIEVAKFYVGDDAYSRFNLCELPLNYLRQQRCGYNPVHGNCHQLDGFKVLSGEHDGESIDVRGGWHDASDYLQYLPTSANTVYQLLFAYAMKRDGWADLYDAYGNQGANGVPDILDEARWGLSWMLRMNPNEGEYYNQIADDRDHRYVGVPQNDNSDYDRGPGNGRPVYPVCGKPYGLRKYKNRSTGEASSVAKFASSFALGADIFAPYDSLFADSLRLKSVSALDYALLHPGASQTACCVSPYFYEEDNWVDDVELAAASRGDYRLAAVYGRLEPQTPWMGADSARHYQWYPFVNIGHYILAEQSADSTVAVEFQEFMREGLQKVANRGKQNAFKNGTPFIWCSNNLAVAFVTQAMLYRNLTGDTAFVEEENAVRDWLFGLNPWGQTMIILPSSADIPSPVDPHSAMTDLTVHHRPGRDYLVGGLVDGPVYSSIFNALWGVHLRRGDDFAPFHGRAIYHDDYSDYSTNEPTMDGTASLMYILSQLCKER